MPLFLISFDDGAMQFPREDLPAVAEASNRVVNQAREAGVWVFGGGFERQQSTVVGTDVSVSAGPFPEVKAVLGGFSVVDVPTREEAHRWAAKISETCRCAQEVREFLPGAG